MQRPVPDHHPGGVCGRVAEQAFGLFRDVEELLDDEFVLLLLLQARLFGARTLDGDGFDTFDGDEFR